MSIRLLCMEKIHAEEFFMEQMRRNLKRVVWILAVLILALVVRLFWIQILGSEDLKQAVCDQSLISLQGANTRGLIYDRNGLPMVADHKRYLYIIRKKDMDFQAAKLLASADAEETGSGGDYYVYSSRKYKKTIGKNSAKNTMPIFCRRPADIRITRRRRI